MIETFSHSIDEILDEADKLKRLHVAEIDRIIVEIISKYDFIVGSIECKLKLEDILTDKANIYYSPYVEKPTTVYVIKKFNVMDLLTEPKIGYWIDDDGDNAICSCCNRLNHLYGEYCKHCGAKIKTHERSK